MTEWRDKLAAKVDLAHIVRVDRSPGITEKIDGYVVGLSELFVMLHVVDPNYLGLDGYIVLRNEDIRRYRVRDSSEFFLDRALKLKGIRPVPQPAIDLSSFTTLLRSVSARYPLVTIEREFVDPDVCFIGRVQKLTDKTVTLEEIDTAAKWERTRRYSFKDITKVQFGGGYEEALLLVAEHEARQGSAPQPGP